MIEIICYGVRNKGIFNKESSITGSLYIFYDDNKASAAPEIKKGFIKMTINKMKEHKNRSDRDRDHDRDRDRAGKKRDWIPDEEWKAMPPDQRPPRRDHLDRKWIPEEEWKAMPKDKRPPKHKFRR